MKKLITLAFIFALSVVMQASYAQGRHMGRGTRRAAKPKTPVVVQQPVRQSPAKRVRADLKKTGGTYNPTIDLSYPTTQPQLGNNAGTGGMPRSKNGETDQAPTVTRKKYPWEKSLYSAGSGTGYSQTNRAMAASSRSKYGLGAMPKYQSMTEKPSHMKDYDSLFKSKRPDRSSLGLGKSGGFSSSRRSSSKSHSSGLLDDPQTSRRSKKPLY
jgi:hypothetical protein